MSDQCDKLDGPFVSPSVGADAFVVLVISDVRFMREALADLLWRDQIAAVVEQAADQQEAIEKTQELQPDLVLLDAAFPDGLAAAVRLRSVGPCARAIIIGVDETAETVIAWAEAGIAGYVPKTAALGDLIALISGIVSGEQACSARVAASLLHRVAATGLAVPDAALTARELQIVHLIADGFSNKDIARFLDIGLSTTKSHVHNLLRKLNLQRRCEAVLWLHRQPQVLRGREPERRTAGS